MKPLIAITGSVAAGKSFVARALANRGAYVVDADALAREALAPGTQALEAVANAFGADLVDPSGKLDRELLAKRVFGAAAQVEKLNAIVHPAVQRLSQERMRLGIASEAPYVLYDVPLLFETGRHADFDAIVVAHAPDAVRHARIESRDGPKRAQTMKQRETHQMSQAQKCALADYVVHTDVAPHVLEAKLDALHASLSNRLARAATRLGDETG